MGPALPASHGPRRWDVGQAPCERRPDTRWSGRAPPREQRGRSQSRPADRVRTEEMTLDTVNPIQGGLAGAVKAAADAHPDQRIALWFMDEARVGQKGRTTHRWWVKGQR